MENLKIYDPDPEKSFTKAKGARLKQEHTEVNVPVDIETVATNHINKFPTADSAFTNDFNLLPKFVPADTSEHLKNVIQTLGEIQYKAFECVVGLVFRVQFTLLFQVL